MQNVLNWALSVGVWICYVILLIHILFPYNCMHDIIFLTQQIHMNKSFFDEIEVATQLLTAEDALQENCI